MTTSTAQDFLFRRIKEMLPLDISIAGIKTISGSLEETILHTMPARSGEKQRNNFFNIVLNKINEPKIYD